VGAGWDDAERGGEAEPESAGTTSTVLVNRVVNPMHEDLTRLPMREGVNELASGGVAQCGRRDARAPFGGNQPATALRR